jgi:hypothetical protein
MSLDVVWDGSAPAVFLKSFSYRHRGGFRSGLSFSRPFLTPRRGSSSSADDKAFVLFLAAARRCADYPLDPLVEHVQCR